MKDTIRRILKPFRLVGLTALGVALFAVLWMMVAAVVLFPIACWACMLIVLGIVVENVITRPEGWSLIDNVVLLVGSWVILGTVSASIVEYMWFEEVDPLMPDMTVDILLVGVVWKNVDTSVIPALPVVPSIPETDVDRRPPDEDARTAYSIDEERHYPIDEETKQ